jgi:hypothetical protein
MKRWNRFLQHLLASNIGNKDDIDGLMFQSIEIISIFFCAAKKLRRHEKM